MKPVLIILTLAAFSQCGARKLSRCGLVRELRRNGFPESKMRDWVCLVEKESGRQTHVISKRNRNGSRDYGLFQINDNYWCSRTNKPGKDCNVTCKQLVTNNISKAATCAKMIYQRHGFNAWYGWKNHCRGKRLPNISSCKK